MRKGIFGKQHITGYRSHSDFYNCFKCGKPLPYFELCNCYLNDIIKKYTTKTDREICEMSNKIQMTRKQADFMWNECICNNDTYEEFIMDMTNYGYIKKSTVEEAEELLDQWRSRTHDSDNQVFNLVNKQHEAIQELKKQIQLNEEAKEI